MLKDNFEDSYWLQTANKSAGFASQAADTMIKRQRERGYVLSQQLTTLQKDGQGNVMNAKEVMLFVREANNG